MKSPRACSIPIFTALAKPRFLRLQMISRPGRAPSTAWAFATVLSCESLSTRMSSTGTSDASTEVRHPTISPSDWKVTMTTDTNEGATTASPLWLSQRGSISPPPSVARRPRRADHRAGPIRYHSAQPSLLASTRRLLQLVDWVRNPGSSPRPRDEPLSTQSTPLARTTKGGARTGLSWSCLVDPVEFAALREGAPTPSVTHRPPSRHRPQEHLHTTPRLDFPTPLGRLWKAPNRVRAWRSKLEYPILSEICKLATLRICDKDDCVRTVGAFFTYVRTRFLSMVTGEIASLGRRARGDVLHRGVWHAYRAYEQDRAVLPRQLRRAQVLDLFPQGQPCPIGMPACATARFCARTPQALGHSD